MAMDTVLLPLIGGVLIGLAAGAFMLLTGRIAGISGLFAGAIQPGEAGLSRSFVAGLIGGGALLLLLSPGLFPAELETPLAWVIAAGFLVGFGTRLGSGCTSGHGVCGLGRLSPRSLAATMTFMGTGVLSVLLLRHITGVL
jgi:uncharacterized membrane protein YedE/YeeE